METFNIPLNKVDLKLLVCGLYTISENDRFFKKIKFKKDKFSLDKQDLHEFRILLNSPPLRKFAFKLLKPLLNKNNSLSSIKDNQFIQDESYNEIILLKKYLRKFKYNYYRFFYFQNISSRYFFTEKETNKIAIRFLFLLVGI